MPTFLEQRYRRQHLRCVRHITLDPKGRGAVRIHMLPPREDAPSAPFLLLLNGDKLVPLNLSWAILLANFMDRLEPFAGLEIGESDWRAMADAAVAETHKTYPFTKKADLADDLTLMLTSLVAIARGQEPEAEVGVLSLGEYASQMTAPHRMDLMVSAMHRDGAWHCNQKCLHCYAAASLWPMRRSCPPSSGWRSSAACEAPISRRSRLPAASPPSAPIWWSWWTPPSGSSPA